MKIKKILALLFLIAAIVIQSQLVAFAEEPPGVDSPFGDTGEDTGPPSLEGGGTDDDGDAPVDDDTDTDTADEPDTSADTGAETQDDTSGGENIISESGPGVAFLLIPSLILGYAYKKKKC